jgi:hypothetical protein
MHGQSLGIWSFITSTTSCGTPWLSSKTVFRQATNLQKHSLNLFFGTSPPKKGFGLGNPQLALLHYANGYADKIIGM